MIEEKYKREENETNPMKTSHNNLGVMRKSTENDIKKINIKLKQEVSRLFRKKSNEIIKKK